MRHLLQLNALERCADHRAHHALRRWYHSQETNVLIDSTIICADWIHTLSHNQNTHLYGLVDPKDGRWRNEKGQTVEELDQIALAAKEKLAREAIKD